MNSTSAVLLRNVLTKVRTLEASGFVVDTDVAGDVYETHKRALLDAHERLASALVGLREPTLRPDAFLSLRLADKPDFRETRVVSDPNTLVVFKRNGQFMFMVGSLRGGALVDINTRFLEPDTVDAENDARALAALLTRGATAPPLLTLFQFLQQQRDQEQQQQQQR